MNASESPAETLRRAAKLMRERAEAASTGEPWKAFQNYDALYGINLRPSLDPVIPFGEVATADMEGCQPREDPRFLFAVHERAEHIASWHPGVTMAVAAWLADEADDSHCTRRGRHALNVARAYLGGAS